MAVSKKGWRSISVGSQSYRWRAIGTDWGIAVVVVTNEAFTRGKTSQKLRFTLDYDHRRIPQPSGSIALNQRAAVTPSVIRLAIEHALKLSPAFTGAYDTPDIVLPPETVARLQDAARLDFREI